MSRTWMLLAAMALVPCASLAADPSLHPADPDLIPEARHVLEYLASQYGKHTLIGATDGVTPTLYEVTGRFPAIQAFDLCGWNSPTWGPSYTQVISQAIDGAKAWWSRGGIVSMQFHWKNPTRPDGSAWVNETGPVDLAEAIKPGTSVNRALMADLAKHADYLQRLADAKVPVLWRPFHEIDGTWFWWTDGKKPENTAALWRLMFDYLVKKRGLHNLIWIYSAGVHPWGLQQALKREPTLAEETTFRKRYYPGGEYVDIAGIDLYPQNAHGDVCPQAFPIMQQVAPGKMLAMCESGEPLNPDMMAKAGPKWLYNLQWFVGEPQWDRKVYPNEYVTTFERLPALNSNHVPPAGRIVEPLDGSDIGSLRFELKAEGVARGGKIAKIEYLDLPGAWRNWFEQPATVRMAAFRGAPTIASVGSPGLRTKGVAEAGFHTIVAKITDTKGAIAYSNAARVTVGLRNFAQGKTATASVKPEEARLAFDDNLFSSWNCLKDDLKANPEQWLAVDLGAEKTIGCVAVTWWKAYAKSFRIEISTDGRGWSTVCKMDDKGWPSAGDTDVFRFSPVKARHVRLCCLQPATSWGGYTVYELGVYGPFR